MYIDLDRQSSQPLYIQVAQNIRRRIRSGALPPGTRLPTVRDLAQQLGVTRLTVHNAYSDLQADGWVEATVGRGTFVSTRQEIAPTPEYGREFSPRSAINDMMRMAQLPGMRSVAMADAAPEFYPLREFNRAVDELLTTSGVRALAYTTSQGEPTLRNAIADWVRERGIRVGPDEIIVTSGVTQGLALIAQTLTQPGDVVLVEHPTYLGTLNVLENQGLRPIGVPVDDEGMVVEVLESLILSHRPRFIYTIPVFHNPTGVCLSPQRRAALLELVERQRVPLVEDDIYSHLVYEGSIAPSLIADDCSGMVLHTSSFSKSLLPGMRIGYVVAPPPLISRLSAAKQANDLCSPALNQQAMALLLQRGVLTQHLRRTLPRYRERRDVLLDAMAQYFPSTLRWTRPNGGFSVWVELPLGVSATDLYLAAIERRVAFAPGDVFFAMPSARSYMRLSFSAQPPETLIEIAQVLGELLHIQTHRRKVAIPETTDWVPLV